MDGEACDESSGLSHLAHAAANIMFEIERRRDNGSGKCNVEITCPRCQGKDEYPVVGVWSCTTGCGYFVEASIDRVTGVDLP